jgi:hypothetical protein
MPNDRPRSGMLTAGGVLAIISGALGIIVGLGFAIATAFGLEVEVVRDTVTETWVLGAAYAPLGIVGIILGVLAMVGGSRAFARKNFGWAITGGICALLCGGLLGLLSLIFIAVTKREFE